MIFLILRRVAKNERGGGSLLKHKERGEPVSLIRDPAIEIQHEVA
jgi:hypothetical protein